MAKGIFKRGDVYWIRYAGLDGRELRETSGSTKFRDAETLLLERKQCIREGKQPILAKQTQCSFGELAEKYLAWMEGRHRSAYSKACRIKDMREQFGNVPLKRFNTVLVEQYQTGLIKRNLKPASVNKNISILKAMFAKAVEWGLVEEETLKHVRKVKQLQENNRRLRYLSQEECQKLLAVCEKRKEHLKPFIITALNTGMRRGEILNLKWDNVDLRHGFILLEVTKNGERREIPINDTLRGVLEGLALNNLDGSKYVFHDKEGKPYQGVKTSFKTACTDAGITNFHFHDLRHTFASHLVMAGIDITTVKELLGHKTLTMTLRYAHLAPTHKVKALAVLDSTINQPTAQKPHSANKKGLTASRKSLFYMVGDAGFEPATPAV